jgi:hypothetical protein
MRDRRIWSPASPRGKTPRKSRLFRLHARIKFRIWPPYKAEWTASGSREGSRLRQVLGLVGVGHCRPLVSGLRERTTHPSPFVTAKIVGGTGLELPAPYLVRRRLKGLMAISLSTGSIRLDPIPVDSQGSQSFAL